ncbi:hypothetical protein [Sanguibacter sp. 25GB23B1]|uniref:hypothetical protein n=1 Tax=unclassified Sanguibacter TaxID=2645534 RepID=UPI0032AE899A
MTSTAMKRSSERRSRRRGVSLILTAALVPAMAGCANGDAGSQAGTEPSGSVTQEESQTSVASASEMWAEFYGVSDPPEVEMIAEVMPEERQRYIDDCLGEAGVIVLGPGLIHVPVARSDEVALAQYTCAMQYGSPARYTQEWGVDQKHIQYTWTLVDVIPCLEAQGHSTVGMPGQLEFVGSYDTKPFFPFAQVRLDVLPKEENAEWARLEAECPQMAPSEVLWDGMSIEEWRAKH